jgi:hypothetical protein
MINGRVNKGYKLNASIREVKLESQSVENCLRAKQN